MVFLVTGGLLVFFSPPHKNSLLLSMRVSHGYKGSMVSLADSIAGEERDHIKVGLCFRGPL